MKMLFTSIVFLILTTTVNAQYGQVPMYGRNYGPQILVPQQTLRIDITPFGNNYYGNNGVYLRSFQSGHSTHFYTRNGLYNSQHRFSNDVRFTVPQSATYHYHSVPNHLYKR